MKFVNPEIVICKTGLFRRIFGKHYVITFEALVESKEGDIFPKRLYFAREYCHKSSFNKKVIRQFIERIKTKTGDTVGDNDPIRVIDHTNTYQSNVIFA
jgi:hypothetical protein